MKIAFLRADKIFFGERFDKPVKTVTIRDYHFEIFDRDFFFDSKTQKVKSTKSDGVVFIYIKVEGFLCRAISALNLESTLKRMESDAEMVDSFYSRCLAAVKNPDAYNVEKRNQKEFKQKENDARAKAQLESKLKEEKEESERLVNGLKSYFLGNMVGWDIFEYGCKKFDIKIPIRTLGAARKSIDTLNNSYRFRVVGNSKVYESLNKYVSALNEC